MIITLVSLLLASGTVYGANDAFIIDTIILTVNGDPVCKSDFEIPQIRKNGGQYNVEEAVTERLIVQEAARKQQLPSQVDVDRQITSLKIQQNLGKMNDKEFDRALRTDGLTLPLYKQQLGRLLAIENNKRIEVSDRVMVTSQMVEAYCQAHPKYTKSKYNLARVVLDATDLDQLKDAKSVALLNWKNVGWIEEEALRPELKGVVSLTAGQLTKPIKQDDGSYHVFKVVEKQPKRLKSLSDRYTKVHRRLHQEEANRRAREHNKALWSNARLRFMSGV